MAWIGRGLEDHLASTPCHGEFPQWLIQAVLFIWKMLVNIILINKGTILQLCFRTVKCWETFSVI